MPADPPRSIEHQLSVIHQRLRACARCPRVFGPAVHGPPVNSPILLVGQAPGAHEKWLGRPFAYTAGRTLFKWLGSATGADEGELRRLIYFAAVARCFPGKNASGAGDRPPSALEITNCREFLRAEVEILRPRLILAVGRAAIAETLGPALFPKSTPLARVVGRKFGAVVHGVPTDVLPLPHPSGVSRWPNTEPGRTLLTNALEVFGREFRAVHAGLSRAEEMPDRPGQQHR